MDYFQIEWFISIGWQVTKWMGHGQIEWLITKLNGTRREWNSGLRRQKLKRFFIPV